jgi:hypothetical protein
MKLQKYIQAEIKEIKRFQQQEKKQKNKSLDRNTAALLWIRHHANTFRDKWGESEQN